MESHKDHGPLHEQEPHHTSVGPGHHTVAEGDQGEQHHEKKSVFSKVKERAKKMKDTLTGHGHGLDEEDDEDDQEKFEDPQIHDSPIKDGSEGIRKTRQEHNLPAARSGDLPTSVAPTGSHDQFSPELSPPKPFTAGPETFDSTKPQEHDHELGADHRPSDKISAKNVVGDKDNTTGVHDHEGVSGRPLSDQSSYTQKISSATSAIADRAISAKNLVALKLGYGEKDNKEGHEVPGTGTSSTANQQQQQHGVEGNNQEKGGGGSVKGYFAEKLKPGEEDKALSGTGTSSTANQQQQQHGVEGNNQEKGGGRSVKGYLAEKLKPGEEDKALSEVITETLHKRKPKQQQKQEAPRPVGEVIKDAMHKRNDDPDGEVNNRPMGKVTESEEVARRLGYTKDDQALGNKGMVDKIKGAVGSWFGQGEQSPGSQPGPARDDTGHTNN